MDKYKRIWSRFLKYIEINKKSICNKYFIFLIVSSSLLIIDLVLKFTLFQKVTHENWLFGIRSVKNTGLTFLPWLNSNIGLISFFNITILLICFFSIIFVNKNSICIWISLIFAGSLGNTIDRLIYGYVRDIIYIPWFDKGTFNVADIIVSIGTVFLAIDLLITTFIKKAGK